jgi:hypothetical protein
MDDLTTKERDDALRVIFEEAPHLPASEAAAFLDAVLSLAKRLHRLYEAECNAPMSPAQRNALASYEAQLRAHFDGAKLGLYLNGDPRGNPVGILTPKSGRYNTMGGREVGWRL